MATQYTPLYRLLLSLTVTAGVPVLLGACHSAPTPLTIVQECIHIPGSVAVIPGIVPDAQIQASDTAHTRIDPLTGKAAGLGGLVVTVLNPVGRPIERAEVNVRDTDRGRTGKDGRIVFRVLAPREHRITVAAPGLLPQELAVVARRGFTDSVRVYLTSRSLGLPCDQRR
jgi:hypothetical protein